MSLFRVAAVSAVATATVCTTSFLFLLLTNSIFLGILYRLMG